MVKDAQPSGAPITQKEWFKSTRNMASDVVSDLTPAQLTNASVTTPIAYGTEDGILYVEFKVSSFSSFGYFTTTSSFVLPVTLEYFRGVSENCEALLRWKTTSESGVKGYEIETSTGSADWQYVKTINPAVNTTGDRFYSTRAAMTAGKLNLYRLKIVDIDGKFKYSPVVALKCDDAGELLSVAPNPTHDFTYLSGLVTGDIVSIILAEGRLMSQNNVSSNILQIDTQKWAVEIYIINVTHINGSRSSSIKMIKK